MDFKQLRYFMVLAEELNFNRAALRLNMSQPPLSRQIQQLEMSLGVRLFDRTTRGVELTDAGVALKKDASMILAGIDRCRDNVVRVSKGEAGRLDIAIFGSGILWHIPQLLLTFRRTHPQVQINLYELSKSEQIEGLRDGSLSLGFNRRVPAQPDITVETVYTEALCLALQDDHPLAQRAEIEMQDIIHEPLVLYPSNTRPSFMDTVVAYIEDAGGHAIIAQEAPNVITAIALVASGFGLCIVPMAAQTLTLPGVVYRPIRSREPMVIEQAVLYRTGDKSPLLNSFLTLLRAYRPSGLLGG